MDAGVAAAIVMAIAGAVGWLAARRLAAAPNMERLRRQSLVVLSASIATVAAAVVYTGTAMLADDGGSAWNAPGRAALVAVPALVVWIITLPRTWVLVRRRAQLDPLSWVGPATQDRVSSSAYAVPLGSSMAAAALVVLTPTSVVELPYGVGLAGLLAALAAATVLIDSRQRHRRARDLRATAAPARVLVPTGR